MFDSTDLLRALGDVGVISPAAGDRGDKQVRRALEREISGRRRASRRFRLPFSGRSIALIPAVLIMAGATTAGAGTLALFHADPAALFESTPSPSEGLGLPRETAVPSSARMITAVHVPRVGAVQYWVADTTQHGLCQALRLPDGTWAGENSHPGSRRWPTCYPTREEVVKAMMAAQGGKLRVGLLPTSVDERFDSVKDSLGRWWVIYYGIVSANGAAAVKDPVTGQTAPAVDGRYFVLVAREPGNCVGCDNLRAIDKNGHTLPANYGPQQDRNH